MTSSPTRENTADEDRAADEATVPFGEHAPTRFGADVEYRGRAQGRDYVARVRHRLLDTSLLLEIDGVEHDPAAEEKAREAAEKDSGADETGEEPLPADDLRFRVDDGFTTLRCTVLRADEDGEHTDHEVIVVRTAGLGGAGEVEVTRGLRTDPLVPAEDSPSARREERRAAHPTRFATIAAIKQSLRYLVPLLGLGTLFSGLLDPILEWLGEKARPLTEAVAKVVNPVLAWVDDLTRPVRDLVAGILRPIARAIVWLWDLLFGWIPDLSLPFDVPDWLPQVVIAVIVVVAAFAATSRGIRHRRDQLEKARRGEDPEESPAEDAEAQSEGESGAEADAEEPDGR